MLVKTAIGSLIITYIYSKIKKKHNYYVEPKNKTNAINS